MHLNTPREVEADGISLSSIIHFVLFVFASVDLHLRRQQNRRSRAGAKNVEMYNQDPESMGAQAPGVYYTPYGSEQNPIQTTVTANK